MNLAEAKLGVDFPSRRTTHERPDRDEVAEAFPSDPSLPRWTSLFFLPPRDQKVGE